MAIAFDANSQGETNSATSLTVSHTCTGSDRVLIVAVDIYVDGATLEVPTATYNGVSMTEITNVVYGLDGSAQRLTLFRLVAPATGANDIVITAASTQNELNLTAVSYTGVDQTTPVDTASTNVNDNTTSTTMDISSATDDLVIDAVSWYNGTITVGSGQTQRVLNDNGSGNDSVSQSDEAGTGTVTMSHSWSAGEYSGHIAVNLNVAASAPALTTSGIINGGGSIAPIVTHAGDKSATVNGGGSLTATVARVGTASEVVNGGGSIAPVAAPQRDTSATINGGGSISAVAAPGSSIAGTINGGGSISGTSLHGGVSSATLNGGGRILAATGSTVVASGTINGGGGLASTTTGTHVAADGINGGGGLAQAATGSHNATDTVNGGGSITPVAVSARAVAGAINAGGSIAATVIPSSGVTYTELALTPVGDPESNINHELFIRYRHSTGAQIDRMHFELRDGATVIYGAFIDWQATSFVEFSDVISALEADSITDYTNLSVRLWMDATAVDTLEVSEVRFEVPIAAPSSTSGIINGGGSLNESVNHYGLVPAFPQLDEGLMGPTLSGGGSIAASTLVGGIPGVTQGTVNGGGSITAAVAASHTSYTEMPNALVGDDWNQSSSIGTWQRESYLDIARVNRIEVGASSDYEIQATIDLFSGDPDYIHGSDSIMAQNIKVIPGVSYRVSALAGYIFTDDDAQVSLGLQWHRAGGSFVSISYLPFVALKNQAILYSGSVTAPTNARYARVKVRYKDPGIATNDVVWARDFEVLQYSRIESGGSIQAWLGSSFPVAAILNGGGSMAAETSQYADLNAGGIGMSTESSTVGRSEEGDGRGKSAEGVPRGETTGLQSLGGTT